MPYKDKEKQRENSRKYYETHKDEIRDYREENREKLLAQYKEYYEKHKAKVDQILGIKCVICGGTHRLTCHEIHGKPHTTRKNYILEHPEDFIRLCFYCHRALHYLSTQTDVPIDVLLVELRELIQTHIKLD